MLHQQTSVLINEGVVLSEKHVSSNSTLGIIEAKEWSTVITLFAIAHQIYRLFSINNSSHPF